VCSVFLYIDVELVYSSHLFGVGSGLCFFREFLRKSTQPTLVCCCPPSEHEHCCCSNGDCCAPAQSHPFKLQKLQLAIPLCIPRCERPRMVGALLETTLYFVTCILLLCCKSTVYFCQLCDLAPPSSCSRLTFDSCEMGDVYLSDVVRLWPKLSWLELTYMHDDWQLLK